jgi:ceramide glucosyltransferase
VLSVLLLIWQWLEALAFPLHRCVPEAVGDSAPAVSLLKPLKGADAETEACLRSWFTQDYPGRVELLFGIHTPEDPAGAVVRVLQGEFPHADARLVICPERLGPNSKVSKLAQLEPLARHDVLVISDADVWVPPDFLRSLAAPFTPPPVSPDPPAPGAPLAASPRPDAALPSRPTPVGLVNPFYALATPATAAMRWESLAVNADFWSSVLQARRFGPLRFALGAVMAVRRPVLSAIGGFRALVSHLADDYELGRQVAAQGSRVELCPVVATCRESARGWGAVWQHQVRWTRTIRHCQPLPFAFSLLSNATLWPVLWAAVVPGLPSLAGLGVTLATRLAMAAHCQWRLTRSWQHLPWIWLAPVKDLLGAGLWALAFAGNEVEWRGERYRVRTGGELERVN